MVKCAGTVWMHFTVQHSCLSMFGCCLLGHVPLLLGFLTAQYYTLPQLSTVLQYCCLVCFVRKVFDREIKDILHHHAGSSEMLMSLICICDYRNIYAKYHATSKSELRVLLT